jgi:hypothetical protein
MQQKISRDVIGSMKVLSAAIGAIVGVTIGTISAAGWGAEAATGTASNGHLPLAPVTVSTAPTELATPSASPTYTATPCPKRATMPC